MNSESYESDNEVQRYTYLLIFGIGLFLIGFVLGYILPSQIDPLFYGVSGVGIVVIMSSAFAYYNYQKYSN